MVRWLESSLPARVGIAVIIIAVLSVCSSLSASLIAWISEDDAAAINMAGSLRMATYRLNWRLEAHANDTEITRLREDLERRLMSEELAHVIGDERHSPVHDAYHAIQDTWQALLSPALTQRNDEHFINNADHFVEQLDKFVLLLQKQSEHRQSWQQSIQGAALLLTVMILLFVMHDLSNRVILPLQELVSTTERFRAGDWQARVRYRSEDELGQMAERFNEMADAITESHQTLERRVADKTLRLAQTNAALDLLYQASNDFATKPAKADQLNELVASFQGKLAGLRLNLCLRADTPGINGKLISLDGNHAREICSRSHCDTCDKHAGSQQNIFSINSQGNTLGELRAYYMDGHAPEAWEISLIEALANLIGTSLSLERQREQDNRLLLLDERTTIARELHDSLAQSLTYLKLQVSRLQMLVRRGESQATLERVSEEMREGLNAAYRQLRELLTTFRLQIQDGGLGKALDDTAREFAQRGDMAVELQNEPLAIMLSATEQIHLLQIAREALSNCARHANAEHAWIRLHQIGEEVQLVVEDDGGGIDFGFDQQQHHGLHIMQERARRIRGELIVSPRVPHGTAVTLNFRPEFLVN